MRAVCGPRGSPPRRRGKGSAGLGGRDGLRITPAQAGKSFFGAAEGITGQDHPRAGGEKRWRWVSTGAGTGSPPRGRGKGRCGVKGQRPFRITPAWAGKRKRLPPWLVICRDHPRVGGEKPSKQPLRAAYWGSPPRGRGKVQLDDPEGGDLRITPAWAGKSSNSAHAAQRARDHPRVGGEKLEKTRPDIYRQGSPPRGRGKVPFFRRFATIAGITPAWAGKRWRAR